MLCVRSSQQESSQHSSQYQVSAVAVGSWVLGVRLAGWMGGWVVGWLGGWVAGWSGARLEVVRFFSFSASHCSGTDISKYTQSTILTPGQHISSPTAQVIN